MATVLNYYFDVCHMCFIPDLKSRYDEEKSLREVAEQKVTSLQQDLQRERQEKDKLHTDLVNFPSQSLTSTNTCMFSYYLQFPPLTYHL